MRMPNSNWPAGDNDQEEIRVNFTARDVSDAARLLGKLARADTLGGPDGARRREPKPVSATARQQLHQKALALIDERRLREQFFNPSIFGEPAWEILLALYVADSGGERETAVRLAQRIQTPLTSILRWIAYLERERLIERRAHPTDRRKFFIQLGAKGRQAVEHYLTALF
jgi:DNA-binding MarR family transcriptional regulator